jgi:hypothetical protein
MAPPTLFLGTKVSVDTSGNVNFADATLSSKGSTLMTITDVSAIVQRIDDDIAFMRNNSDPASLDSLAEIVQRASNIDASLNEEISARAAADSALGLRIDSEESARAAAVSAEASARAAADSEIRAISVRSNRIMPLDISVYADAAKPTAKELVSTLTPTDLNYDGWYYRNLGAGNKINWYVGTTPNTTLDDIKAVMADNLVIKKTSPLFLTVYTARTGEVGEIVPVGGSSWYKSRLTYIINNTNLISEGQSYRFVAKLDSSAPDVPVPHNHTGLALTLDEFSSRYKDVNGNSVNLPTDKILFFSVGTNSSSSAGNVEFILSKFAIQKADGVHEHLFTNDSVSAKFYAEKIQALYSYFFNKDIIGADSAFVPENA